MDEKNHPKRRQADFDDVAMAPPAIGEEGERIAPNDGQKAERSAEARPRRARGGAGTTRRRTGRNRGRHSNASSLLPSPSSVEGQQLTDRDNPEVTKARKSESPKPESGTFFAFSLFRVFVISSLW
jgi:hypothetical protein